MGWRCSSSSTVASCQEALLKHQVTLLEKRNDEGGLSMIRAVKEEDLAH